MAHWLWIHLGLDAAGGPWYQFWSGIGGIVLISGSVFSIPYTTWKRHNCHLARCLRIGRYQAGDMLLCRRHHPDPQVRDGLTAGHIRRRYEDQEGRHGR